MSETCEVCGRAEAYRNTADIRQIPKCYRWTGRPENALDCYRLGYERQRAEVARLRAQAQRLADSEGAAVNSEMRARADALSEKQRADAAEAEIARLTKERDEALRALKWSWIECPHGRLPHDRCDYCGNIEEDQVRALERMKDHWPVVLPAVLAVLPWGQFGACPRCGDVHGKDRDDVCGAPPNPNNAEAECERLTKEVQEAREHLIGAYRQGKKPIDHACEQCAPYSEILVPGFVCWWHAGEALALAPPNPSPTPSDK